MGISPEVPQRHMDFCDCIPDSSTASPVSIEEGLSRPQLVFPSFYLLSSTIKMSQVRSNTMSHYSSQNFREITYYLRNSQLSPPLYNDTFQFKCNGKFDEILHNPCGKSVSQNVYITLSVIMMTILIVNNKCR